jgi:hypothetical protein
MKQIIFFMVLVCSISYAGPSSEIIKEQSRDSEGVLSLIYGCQIGEKPGVPSYNLEISANHFKTWKKIATQETTHILAEGILNKKEQEDLKHILDRLSKITVNIKKSEELEGHFSLEFKVNDNKTVFAGGSSKKVKELKEITHWINKFHNNKIALNKIRPIFPGDPYRVEY